MKYISISILTLILFSLNGCAVKDFNYMEKNQDKNSSIRVIDDKTYEEDALFEWKIVKGDRIEIQAFNQSSNTANGKLTQLLSNGGQKYYTQRYGDEGILIGPDGNVMLPLIGNIKLIGLTEIEASELLIAEYKKYLKNPYVTVKILNQKLFVIGEVKKPGVVLVTNGTMTLFEALAYTGDLTDFANRTNIKVLRGGMRNPEVREINLTDFQSIQYASLILRPNDVVYVEPRDSKASVVGINEELPLWDLVSKILSPFTSAAVIYGVTK
ncbi:MAG: polysaccharide biosynthesis/export family protein [Campylobacterota bacterium]|nr:polysaccharide biosynthesis/export family protein [Campylobacterota bacterium]